MASRVVATGCRLLQANALRGAQALRNVLICFAVNCTRDPRDFVSAPFETVEAGVEQFLSRKPGPEKRSH